MTARTPGITAIRKATDDTLELLALIGRANKSVTLDAGRTYRVRTVAFASGVTLEIPATTVVEIQDNGLAASNFLYVNGVDGVTIFGSGEIRGTSIARTAVYGLIRAVDADDLTVDGITLDTSPSVGFWSQGGSRLRLNDLIVHTTAADGIHISRGADDFHVTGCDVHDTADDGIACVAYIDLGFGPCTNGLFDNNTVTNATVGRGITCSGGQTVTISNNDVDGTDQAGILTAGGGGRAADVTIIDNTVNDTGRDKPTGGTGDCIYLTQTDGATVSGCTISNTPYNGINFIDSLSTALADGGGNTYAGIGLANVHHG